MIKKRRRWRKHRDHQRRLRIWLCLIATFCFVLPLWDEAENLIGKFQSQKGVLKQAIRLTGIREPLSIEEANRPPKYNLHHLTKKQKDGEFWPRVFPYSVVEGGVHSVQELRSVILQDPVIAKHYSNFNLDRARIIEAKADRDFHVSYRIGDDIFWTNKKLKVAKGERLITDGTNSTRTRCANMLSEVPLGKTSPNEPVPEVLNEPLDPLAYEFIQEPIDPLNVSQNLSEIPPISSDPRSGNDQPSPSSEPAPLIPPVLIGGGPPGGIPPGPIPPGPGPIPPGPGPIPPGPGPIPPDPDPIPPGPEPIPPAPVPEPTTMLLVGFGLAGFWGFRKKFKKRIWLKT